jgi:hypothetical protein
MKENKMKPTDNPDNLVDFITGRTVPNIGPEANRQAVERFLVEKKGYGREDVIVDAPIEMEIEGDLYRSTIDLVLQIEGKPLIAVKCAAGSIESREREIVSAARLFSDTPLPLAVVSDGSNAIVLNTQTGKKVGKNLTEIPSRQEASMLAQKPPLPPIPPEKLTRQKLVFRSYDSMNVNVKGR